MKIQRILSLVLALVLCVGMMTVTASAAGEIMYGIGFVNASSLRLRSEPDGNSGTLTYAPRNDCVVVIEKTGDWYKVNYNLQTGYMHASYLSVLTKENAELGYGEVTGSGVNLRSGPATSYGKVATANSGDKCYILGLNEGWYKVIYGDRICYIRSDYLKLTEIPYENQASANTPKFYRQGKSTGVAPSAAALNGTAGSSSSASAPSVSGSAIVTEAQKYLGTPYVYGGASPSGFDCSGFTMYVYSQHGYSLPHSATSQWQSGIGTKVYSISALQPGDLVFFNDPSRNAGKACSHAGIYVGGGQFIHSSSSRSNGVIISDLTSGYYNTYFVGGIHA